MPIARRMNTGFLLTDRIFPMIGQGKMDSKIADFGSCLPAGRQGLRIEKSEI
jgi:hypothetical protein